MLIAYNLSRLIKNTFFVSLFIAPLFSQGLENGNVFEFANLDDSKISGLLRSGVKIGIKKPMGFGNCVGVMLDKDNAVTAAHCGTNRMSTVVSLVADKDRERLKKESLFVKETFSPDFQHQRFNAKDIDYIKLEGSFDHFEKKVYLPHELGLTFDDIKDFKEVYFIGINEDKELVYTTYEWSNANFSSTEFSLKNSDDRLACHGDSGGPALVFVKGKWVLIGVLSHFDYTEEEADTSYLSPKSNRNIFKRILGMFTGENKRLLREFCVGKDLVFTRVDSYRELLSEEKKDIVHCR